MRTAFLHTTGRNTITPYKLFSTTALACLILTAGCSVDPTDIVLAVVGDQSVTGADLLKAEAKLFAVAGNDSTSNRFKLLDLIVNSLLLEQEAQARGLHEDSAVVKAVSRVTTSSLRRHLRMRRVGELSKPVSDNVISAMEGRGVAQAGVRMIGVSTEDSAAQILKNGPALFSGNDPRFTRPVGQLLPKGARPTMDALIFTASPGDIVGPLEVDGVWYVIQLEHIFDHGEIYRQQPQMWDEAYQKERNDNRESAYIDSLSQEYGLIVYGERIAEAADSRDPDGELVIGRSRVDSVELKSVTGLLGKQGAVPIIVDHVTRRLWLSMLEAEAIKQGFGSSPAVIADIKNARNSAMTERLIEVAVLDSLTQVSLEEARGYYEANPEQFRWRTPRVWMNSVTTKSQSAALLAREAIDAGVPWAAVVGRFSIDQNEIRSNGAVGPVELGNLGSLGQYLAGVGLNEVVGPVREEHGVFHVIQVTRRIPPGSMEWGRTSMLIAVNILSQLREETAVVKFIGGLRSKAKQQGRMVINPERVAEIRHPQG